jgi:hypothetical protein
MMEVFEKVFGKYARDVSGAKIRVFEDREFRRFYDQNSGRTFSNLEFRRCRFVSSRISITRKPRRRSTIRNVKLIQCEVLGCALGTAIVEDVVVDGVKTHGQLFQTWGAVFKRVTLKGNIGRIMISPAVATGMAKPREQLAFDEANAAYYAGVDWALDISEARFEGCDIRRVPAHLIRRDPETQMVITREKALLGEWRRIDLSRTYWDTAIELFLEDGDPDVVLVAPKSHPRYRAYLDGLKKLRDAGVAEPD